MQYKIEIDSLAFVGYRYKRRLSLRFNDETSEDL